MSDTHVAFSRSYLPLIYYLTERSLFKKCPPPHGTLKSSKKALFQIDGKTDVSRELIMISVKVGRIHGNASLITFIDTLSAPGALFEGNEGTILRISNVETARNENSSPKKVSEFVGALRKFHFRLPEILQSQLHELPQS
jgi:hypothetical protein